MPAAYAAADTIVERSMPSLVMEAVR